MRTDVSTSPLDTQNVEFCNSRLWDYLCNLGGSGCPRRRSGCSAEVSRHVVWRG